MRLAFLSQHADGDARAWSGIPHHMASALRRQADELVYLQVPAFDLDTVFWDPSAGRRELRAIGEDASRGIAACGPDLVVAQGTSMLPFLRSSAPVVSWHDSTWHSLLQMRFDRFARRHPLLREWDERALATSDRTVYPAAWVATDTLGHYAVDPARVLVAPFGPSLVSPAPRETEARIAARPSGALDLAFVGVDWRRKGLTLAYEVLTALLVEGMEARLHVIGPETDPASTWRSELPFVADDLFARQLAHDPHVRCHGFVEKDTPEGMRHFADLLGSCHYMLHPASFEPFGVALVEANTLGVPVIAIDGFGPSTIIRDGVNGRLFERAGFVESATDFLLRRAADPAACASDARAARAEADASLNWDASVDRLLNAVGGRDEARPAPSLAFG